MKILITGINGFIGQHLKAELVKRGHKVQGSGDVLDKKIIDKQISDVDCVVHLAAKTTHKDLVEKKLEALNTNIEGTKNVLDAFVKSKAKKFIYPSSGKVYGIIKKLPITEEHPTNPLNILGKSKLITEKLIDFYANGDKEFVIFRIFNVYGKDQKDNFLIPTILKQVNQGKKEIILGDIMTKRDYIYIDDVINAFVKAIEREKSSGVSIYNICTEVSSNAKTIVKLVSKIKGKDIKIRVNQSLIRKDEEKDEYGSFDLAKKELGWKPKITLEEGLKKLI